MPTRTYSYVGPREIRDAVANTQPGELIHNPAELAAWLTANSADAGSDGSLTATFVIDCDGILQIGDLSTWLAPEEEKSCLLAR